MSLSPPPPSPSPARLPSPRRLPTEDSATEGSLLLKQQSKTKWQTTTEISISAPEIRSSSPTPSIFTRSLYLRSYFLIGLSILSLSFVAILEVLRHLSDTNHGFVTSDQGKHYLWTYGPTLVLSLVAAVWGQVEYRVLQAIPWSELKRRALPAERNLLMNYVSPWSVTTLFRSLSKGHFTVSLVVLGGIILKALIILSTGLIDLESKQITYETQFSITNQFNLSRYRYQTPVNPADPRIALWAFVQGAGTVRYPAGATPEYAILSATPNALESGSNVTLSAELPVFATQQNCTSFSWAFTSTRGRNTSLSDIITIKDQLDLLSQYCLLMPPYLPRSTRLGNDTKTPFLTSRELRDPIMNRTVLVDTKCRETVLEPLRDSTGVFTSVLVPQQGNTFTLSAVLCLPKYSVTKRHVTLSPGDNILDVSSDILETVEIGDLASSAGPFTNDVLLAGESFHLVTNKSTNDWIDTINFTTPRPDYRDFANATLLSEAFSKSFQAMAALTARFQKTVPAESDQSLAGNVTLKIDRLTITPVTIRVMDALLIILAITALVLFILHMGPRYEPAPTLMDTALILARSDSLSRTLPLNDGAPSAKAVAAKLEGRLFYTTRSAGTAVQMEDHIPILNKKSQEDGGSKWWLPVAASRTYAVSLIAITLVAIVILEVLYQLSRRNGGLAEVSTVGYTRYAWLFLPTFVMACIGLAYVAMDKATQTLHPFLELSRGEGTKDTLEFEPRSSMALIALGQALGRRFFGLSAMILTSILGGILAIAASGLYTPVSFLDAGRVTMDSASWFDLRIEAPGTRSDLWGGGRVEDILPNAVQFNNMTLPAGVFGEYAFALPDAADALAAFPQDPNTAAAKIIARVPAARVQPNCSLHDFRESYDDKDVSGPYLLVDPPAGCVNGPDGVPAAGAKILLGEPDLDRDGYVGFQSTTMWYYSPEPDFLFNSTDGDYAKLSVAKPLCLDGARHDFFVYGYRKGTVNTNLTVIQCSPYTEALVVEGTFHFPNFTVDESAAPPRPVSEITSTPWSSENKSYNAIDGVSVANLAYKDSNLGTFFMLLTRGRSSDMIPISSLAPRDALPAMLARITKVYQEMVALNLHFSYRASPETEIQGRPTPGPITGMIRKELPLGRARLVQSELSTRLLEGLLAALVLCSGLSWWLVGRGGRGIKRGEILPLDPGSVAAKMALLAGSELVERLGREGRRGLEGEKLYLGWWEDSDGRGGKRYGIDVLPRDGG